MKQKISEYFGKDFKRFFDKYLPQVKKIGGNEYQGICPFHEDKNPSFNYDALSGKVVLPWMRKEGGHLPFLRKDQ
jgi:hypothetical protein